MSASATPHRISRDDIEAKLRELDGGVSETKESVMATAVAVGAAVLVGVIALSFLLGKRRGRRRTTVVEVRRI